MIALYVGNQALSFDAVQQQPHILRVASCTSIWNIYRIPPRPLEESNGAVKK